MTNSVDPGQLASSLFAKTGHVFSKRRVRSSRSEQVVRYVFVAKEEKYTGTCL